MIPAWLIQIATKIGIKGMALIAGSAFLYMTGVGHGKDAIRAKIEEARQAEFEKYVVRERVTQQAYEMAMSVATEARTQAPKIIERIRDAPVTQCSGAVVDAERLRLLNAAITGSNSIAGL